ncbi:hypothetical protein JTE90_022758 [Oedothorax gibbosus]|uniref:SEC14-like protein 2 n=1 Tax=Oedothorax gibbosus TaxID=931172 RepID=A0AAV6U8L8_9ARAC|nr:hypothetical protein JTE90_022758 [Oedothorax gibbosus]
MVQTTRPSGRRSCFLPVVFFEGVVRERSSVDDSALIFTSPALHLKVSIRIGKSSSENNIKMTASDCLNLTQEEREAVEELRRRVFKDLQQTNCKDFKENHTLYRFLKARDFDVDQAEIMMRKAYLWKKQNKIDTLAEEYTPPKILQEYFKNWQICHDKEGCPVVYLPIGKYDSKGLHMSAKYTDIEKFAALEEAKFEKDLDTTSEKLNKRLGGVTYIFDMNGLTFANATDKKGIETAIRLIKINQDIYPERLKLAFLINASNLFTFPFNIVKNFIAAKVIHKFRVYGTEGWQEEILKVIDAKELPKFLGGKRTDPDGNPLCKTIVSQGGKVDEKYYADKTKNSLTKYPDVTKLVLSRASFSEIDLHIDEPGSLIEWDFETRSRDIGFGLFRKESEEELTELVPLQRLETSDFFETGMYKCDKAGDYVALFDNSYSWVRSKEIFYRIRIVKPGDLVNQIEKEST